MKTRNKKEKLIPELRFPEFKEEWGSTIFKNEFSFIKNNSLSRKDLNYISGKIKNIHYGDIHKGLNHNLEINKTLLPYINKDKEKKSGELLNNGDLIIADASEDYKDIGKSIEIIDLNNEKVVGGLHTIVARRKEENDDKGFMGYLMQTWTVHHQIMRSANGISVYGIGKESLSKIQFSLPTLPEQQKISSFLSLIDRKIELLNKKKELLEIYKRGVTQKIFNRDIRFKDINGNNYPEWEEKRLGEICKITTGKLDANAMVKDGKYRFYTCAADYFHIDNYDFDTEALIISGNGANVGYIHYYKGKFNAYQRTYVLSNFTDNIHYIKIYLEEYLHKRIDKEKKSGNTPYIVLNTLKDMIIKIPSQVEEKTIFTIINSLNIKTKYLQNSLFKLQIFKKGLLQKMFI